jgi:hypothetical protein
MSDDEPFYSPPYKPPPPPPHQPGECLFEFRRGHDRFLCELRDHGEYGIEAQFFQNETFYLSHRFGTRDRAIEWATGKRAAIEHGPCPRCGGSGWLCEAHPSELADHDARCAGPAMACPTCQPQNSRRIGADAGRLALVSRER